MKHTDLVTRDGDPIRKGRVSPALRTAITLIVHDGLTIAEAAQRTGYKTESLSKALIKPHVRAFRGAVKRAWMESQTEKAWLKMAKLADAAGTDDVQFKATKLFLDQAGELDGAPSRAPAGLVQIIVNHTPRGEQPTLQRLPGVIENHTQQRIDLDASNYRTVGRDDDGA